MMAKKLLGDSVKEERIRRNLSQNTLAECAHISLRTVSDIETYNGNPRFETLVPLVDYLNISLDSIILESKPPMDSVMHQIIAELNDCTIKEKELALFTLRGLLKGLRNQKS